MKKIKILTSLVGLSGLSISLVPTMASCSCNKQSASVELDESVTKQGITVKSSDIQKDKDSTIELNLPSGKSISAIIIEIGNSTLSKSDVTIDNGKITIPAAKMSAEKVIIKSITLKDKEPEPTGEITITLSVDEKKASCNKETITLSEATTFKDAMYGVVVTPLDDGNVFEGWKDENGNLIDQAQTISTSMTITASVIKKADPGIQGYVKYTPIYEDGKITSYSASWNEASTPSGTIDLVILDEYNNKPVTEIGAVDEMTYTGGFFFNQYIKTVTIPNNIQKIGLGAFWYCMNLEKVEFKSGSKLTTIEDGAFCYCNQLSNINLPNTLLYLTAGSFEDVNENLFYTNTTTHAKYLKQDQNNTNNSFACIDIEPDADGITEIDSNCQIIARASFADSVKDLIIPASVVSISCIDSIIGSSIQKISFASNSKLKLLGEVAFKMSGLPSLTQIVLPDNVEFLGNPFVGFNSNKITIDLGQNTKYKKKTVDGNLIIYDELEDGNIEIVGFLSSSDESASKTYTIPNNVEKIASYAFAYTTLTDIVFPEDNIVNSIGDHAFSYSSITKIDLSNWKNMVIVPNYCFQCCTDVKEVIFGDDCKINTFASRSLNAVGSTDSPIASITIPRSVKFINEDALLNAKIGNIILEDDESSWKLQTVDDDLSIKTETKSNIELENPVTNATYLTCRESTEKTDGRADWSWSKIIV